MVNYNMETNNMVAAWAVQTESMKAAVTVSRLQCLSNVLAKTVLKSNVLANLSLNVKIILKMSYISYF